MDMELADVSSKLEMEHKGWSFTIKAHKLDKYKGKCGMGNTWYGHSYPDDGDMSKITATFTGSGIATLDYGNCYGGGMVEVYLNDKRIDFANRNTPSKQIQFHYSPNTVLKLSETKAIIKLNSLGLTCTGKAFLHKYVSL